MDEEIFALEANQTWVVVLLLPPGKKIIGYTWVYKIKHEAYGNVDRYKARPTAKGYNQQYGTEYLDTFSPIAKIVIVCCSLAMAATKTYSYFKWMSQMPFYNMIYMKRFICYPQGFENDNLITLASSLNLYMA